MLQAARGIAAWREPLTVALLIGTSLAEGAALFWLLQPWHGQGGTGRALLFGVLLLGGARGLGRLSAATGRRVAARARAALDRAGRMLLVGGTAVPLVLLAAGLGAGVASTALAALAGVLALAAGAYLKFTLITRAGYNQGFALKEVPVRGARRFAG